MLSFLGPRTNLDQYMATKSTTSKKKSTAKKTDSKATAAKKASTKKTDEKKSVKKASSTKKSSNSKPKAAAKTEVAEKADKPKLPQLDRSGKPRIMADPDAKLTEAQLKGLYDKLISERMRVIEGVKRHVGEAVEDQDRLPDDVDLASRHADQAFLLRFADKEHKLLRQINLALGKMETGEYGVCEGTGEPIGFARLKLRPWTRYSVQYKEELERRRAHEKR